MKKFLLKTKKVDIWVSGSLMNPFSNMYITSHKSKCGYTEVNIFPKFHKVHSYVESTDSFKTSVRFYFTNELPEWMSYILSKHYYWKHCLRYDYNECNEVSFLKFLYRELRFRVKVKNCDHSHMQYTSDFNPESGSEYFYCPDCGFSKCVTYY